MDTRLTEVLVCPQCKGPVKFNTDRTQLHCAKCALGFAVINDIPVMLVPEARSLTENEIEQARIRPTDGILRQDAPSC